MKYISKRSKSGYCATHRTVIRISKQSMYIINEISSFYTVCMYLVYIYKFNQSCFNKLIEISRQHSDNSWTTVGCVFCEYFVENVTSKLFFG